MTTNVYETKVQVQIIFDVRARRLSRTPVARMAPLTPKRERTGTARSGGKTRLDLCTSPISDAFGLAIGREVFQAILHVGTDMEP